MGTVSDLPTHTNTIPITGYLWASATQSPLLPSLSPSLALSLTLSLPLPHTILCHPLTAAMPCSPQPAAALDHATSALDHATSNSHSHSCLQPCHTTVNNAVPPSTSHGPRPHCLHSQPCRLHSRPCHLKQPWPQPPSTMPHHCQRCHASLNQPPPSTTPPPLSTMPCCPQPAMAMATFNHPALPSMMPCHPQPAAALDHTVPPSPAAALDHAASTIDHTMPPSTSHGCGCL